MSRPWLADGVRLGEAKVSGPGVWVGAMRADGNTSSSSWKGIAVSVAIHTLVLLGVVGVLDRRVKSVPYGFPGTRQGMQLLTYYSPGSVRSVENDIRAKEVEQQKPRAV